MPCLTRGAPKWAQRLASLQPVGYRPPPGLRRVRVTKREAEPLAASPESSEWLVWRKGAGTTKTSPAERHWKKSPVREGEVGEFVRHLHESLSLPGTARDYHLIVEYTVLSLWSRVRSEPEALAAIEELSLLDVAILEAYPHLQLDTLHPRGHLLSPQLPGLLARLYEKKGDVDLALALARRVPALLRDPVVARLEAKVRALEEEVR